MHADVVLHPAEIAGLPQRDLSATTCVVFDVLRATSAMITGLAHGVAQIRPVCTIQEARAWKERSPTLVLAGERHGDPIPGFALGNSPREYTGIAGASVVTTTTNGTVALRACEGAEAVLVGALLNLRALAEVLRRRAPRQLLLVCAGTFETFALEDAYAAGRLLAELEGCGRTDAAHLVAALATLAPLDVLRMSRNGQALASAGREDDLEWCARESRYDVVGRLEEGVITAGAPAPAAVDLPGSRP